MSGVEAKLWSYLRRRQLGGHKFRRQAPIGPYVADFVCLATRLVVEIDGPTHEWRRDEKRDRWFEQRGFRVLRFSADEVFWRCEVVLQAIYEAVEAPPPAPGAGTSPASGEGA
jgi:very-short-patch-repair endonuclease